MPAPTPGVVITANLQLILGADADQCSVTVTLCNFGPYLPRVPGAGFLADAGIPQKTTQSGSTPIVFTVFNNTEIVPAGTFYCIAILDAQDNLVQANDYLFPTDGSFDLCTLTPIVAGSPSLFNEDLDAQGLGPTFNLSAAVIGGALIGLFYNGGFQPPLSPYYTLSGQQITLNFTIYPGDSLWAVYLGLGLGGITLPEGAIGEVPAGAIPGDVYTITHAPKNGVLIGFYYNGGWQSPINYTITGTTIDLHFSTFTGDSVYAIYIPA